MARDPRILDRFARCIEEAGVVGETRVIQLVYLSLCSRFLKRPVSLAVKGPSSSGKSFTTDRVLDFFPESAYYRLSASSDRSLIFTDEDFRHRFLYFSEAVGMGDGDSMLQAIIRTLLSEGFIAYDVTIRRPDGSYGVQRIEKSGPTGLITTTTAVRLYGENETRFFSVPTTDTPRQTSAIIRALATDETHEVDTTEWRALQTWLQSACHTVFMPYARMLGDLVPPAAVRLRRDFGALLALIRTHAILHQATRERTHKGAIIASIDDYVVVRGLIADLVSEGVDRTVPADVRETVAAVVRLTDGGAAGLTYSQIGKALDLDKSTAERRVRKAKDYLRNEEERKGKPARIVLGEPLPIDQEILPHPELLSDCESGCAVASISGVVSDPLPGCASERQEFEEGFIE